jgi:hypothetical protein
MIVSGAKMKNAQGLRNREYPEKHVIFKLKNFVYMIWEKALFVF